MIYIGRKISKRMMRVEQIIGGRAPLHVTAVAKLILGMADNEAVRAYAKRHGLRLSTKNTITDVNGLIRHCQQAVNAGSALDNEAEIGGCIGVLLTDERQLPVARLSISAPVDRHPKF